MSTTIVHVVKATGIHGTENHLLTLLPELNKTCRVICLLLTEKKKPMIDYIRLLERRGVEVHNLTISFDFDPACFFYIYTFFKKTKPAIVHSHLIHGDVYGITAAWCAGVRHIVSTKHNDDSFRYRPLLRALHIALNRKTERIIAISDWICRFVQKVEHVPPSKACTIHYGCAPLESSRPREAVRREFGFGDKDIVFCIIARLVEQKGHRYLIDAMEKACHNSSDIKLLIVGDGGCRAQLHKQVTDRQLESAVCFAGFRADVADILNAADVFIHPSLWEGFGLAILEAMTMKKPVIATRVSAIPELVECGSSGILVAPRHAAELADAIITLAADSDMRERYGLAGFRRWKDFFSVQAMVEKTHNLYAPLVSADKD